MKKTSPKNEDDLMQKNEDNLTLKWRRFPQEMSQMES